MDTVVAPRSAAPARVPHRRSHFDVAGVAGAALGLAMIGAAAGALGARVLRVVLVMAVAAVILVLHRRATRSGDAVVIVLGVVAATDGATIGFAYATGVGWSWRTVAGLVAMAGGLAIVAVVGAARWRVTRRWWRLVAVPAALALAAFVVYPVATAVYATAQPTALVGRATPGDRGLAFRDVTFRAADGARLSGWYLPSSNRAAVVLLHGASSTRSGVLDHAEVLNRAGFGVLLFDARGHGRSQGRAMDLGWYGDRDTSAAVDFVSGQPDVDPLRIAAVGMSMGGEDAIGAAAADQRIRAVVAEGAQNRVYADRDDWLPAGVNGIVQRGMDWLAYSLADVLSPAHPPIALREAATRAAPRPILLIAGSGEERAARSIARGAPASVEIWESHTGHTAGLDHAPDEWTRRVVDFLSRALLTA